MHSLILTLAFIQSLLSQAALGQGSCKETSSVDFTFYGFPDGGNTLGFNCPTTGGKGGGTTLLPLDQ